MSSLNNPASPDESEAIEPENLNEINLNQHGIRYRGWLITTKVIDGQLWLRWQHPQENFPRYGCPVSNRGLAETIRHVRFLINLAIKLEQNTKKS